MDNYDKETLMWINFILSMVGIIMCIGQTALFNNGIVEKSIGWSVLVFLFFLIGCPVVGMIYD